MNWTEAHDELLRDQDSLSDWLLGQMQYSKPVGTERCTRYLAMGRLEEAALCSVAELHAVMWTDDDPVIVMAARKVLRQKHFDAHSAGVAELFWQQQDAEREERALSQEARAAL